jgi:hypothetical protein
MPHDWLSQIEFGLFFGVGFSIASAVVSFLAEMLGRARK